MIGKSRFLIGLVAAALTYLSLTALVGTRNYEGSSNESCHETRWHPEAQQAPE
ncbi:MAG: hypothetical protein ACFB15_19445 [Cyclobacteriaceae bacterium]